MGANNQHEKKLQKSSWNTGKWAKEFGRRERLQEFTLGDGPYYHRTSKRKRRLSMSERNSIRKAKYSEYFKWLKQLWESNRTSQADKSKEQK